MTRRRFAEDSSVPVDRSRAEIMKLLQEWGCSAMGWTDHFSEGDVELGFVWDPQGNTLSEIILPKLKAGYLALPAKTGADS